MNYMNNPELVDKLAAEYVLGTLRHGARKRFEQWMIQDAQVQNAVERWQNKLNPLAEILSPITPPSRVWKKIESRLFNKAHSPWWQKLNFWQTLGGMSIATSLVLSVYLINQPILRHQQPSILSDYIAVLSTSEHDPSIIINYDFSKQQLLLTQLHTNSLPSKKTLELWLIPEQGTPISLGVLNNEKAIVVSLKPEQRAQLQRSKAMAVSLEPSGGSPTHVPTGPVLYSGKLLISKINAVSITKKTVG